MVEFEYAKALFDLAIEEKKTQLFLDYFNAVLDVTANEVDFLKLINSPIVSYDDKKQIISKAFGSFDNTFIEFLKLLAKNNRFHLFKEIYEQYSILMRNYNNILKVEIISANKLTNKHQKVILERLKGRYPNKELLIENTLNPKILGGFQIICNGESLDISLNNLLNKMKDSL